MFTLELTVCINYRLGDRMSSLYSRSVLNVLVNYRNAVVRMIPSLLIFISIGSQDGSYHNCYLRVLELHTSPPLGGLHVQIANPLGSQVSSCLENSRQEATRRPKHRFRDQLKTSLAQANIDNEAWETVVTNRPSWVRPSEVGGW